MTDEWEASLATHRAQQRTLIQRAAVDLATERGLSSVGMVDVARRAGISRATLYKYFSSVEAVRGSGAAAPNSRAVAHRRPVWRRGNGIET